MHLRRPFLSTFLATVALAMTSLAHAVTRGAGPAPVRPALVLNSAPDALEYYPKVGLEKLDTAFIRRRTQ